MKIAISLLLFAAYAYACTNFIVSPGASGDGSSVIAYNADSGTVYGMLYHYPAAKHSKGEMRRVFDWDSGKYLGEIPEAEETYNVVGNVNEWGLIIGETTYGGIGSLSSQPGAIVDYGSLIWITLQRAKNAREAIKTMDMLMNTYGYASEGESFSIADNNETWIMEVIGKGTHEKGAVWVAQRVPDGYITAHANQARIRTFPKDDPESCLYSSDVMSFARGIGLYKGTDDEFSFSDVYDPLTFLGARACEARVWTMFTAVMGENWGKQYLDYAQGYNLTNRMPLFVKPPNGGKVSVEKVMELFRSHYENTWFDMTGQQFDDVGALYAGTPERAHPLQWASGGKQYVNERPIATQQTGWNFVAQSRHWLPRELSGVIWFGVDDSSTTVRFPIHGSASRVPGAYAGLGPQDGVTSEIMKFSTEKAFYVFNLVANWAYTR
jgi:dipeptidase